MKRGKPRNERAKSTNRESTNKATQTINIDTVVEIARLQEQLRLLQLENDVLRQHMSTSNKRDHASIYMPLSVETQEIPQANAKAVTCGCKGNCSTKRCGCVKENNKCTASCKCSAATCQNQELKDQNEELDQENKENITTNGMETPKKREKVIQSEVVVKMKTKGKDLASDKITNDEQFDPMKPKHQLSRTPPTKNRTFVSEVSYSDDKLKSESPESSQILVSSFNVKANTSDIEAEVDWEQHRAQLVPCKKCKRTFMPHRIQKHEACCKKI
ncbi:PREDICTED: uncharacterized protein LOC106748332 isoform X2 [Dinoponera quadriceps]|uniref:Uncharacterized protein LOC106748332 isoform X2 n=1 Tax=Dinoponera quadriceps TaxID=609295 RepID=A0A6P3XW59_DINQU|nr:PREDICTED: uncharacterized protein LOC106748332 isoform X2 [Dinoponera quadriceps]